MARRRMHISVDEAVYREDSWAGVDSKVRAPALFSCSSHGSYAHQILFTLMPMSRTSGLDYSSLPVIWKVGPFHSKLYVRRLVDALGPVKTIPLTGKNVSPLGPPSQSVFDLSTR